MLKFNDKQHQLISVCSSGAIGLWDAQKLTRIQLLRKNTSISRKTISACCFFEPLGQILLATTKVFKYKLEVEQKALVHIQQRNAIARDYLRELAGQLKAAGVVDLQQPSDQEDQENQLKLTAPSEISNKGLSKDQERKLAPRLQLQLPDNIANKPALK